MFKYIIHKIMYKNKSLYKPGVGEIILCAGRFRRRGIIDMTVILDQLYDASYVVPRVQEIELERVIKCENEYELSSVIMTMIERRRNTGYEVDCIWTGEK